MTEAMIGHMKQDGMLSRCHLKGTVGDAIHALLCGLGHNMRLLVNFIREGASVGFMLRYMAWLKPVILPRNELYQAV